MADWSGRPAYKQLATQLRQRIRDGHLPLGSQLPSAAELMAEYDVSVTVVRMALTELRREGVISTHQGKGAFVRASVTTGSGEDVGATDYATIMSHLEAVHQDIQQLDKRVAQLEELAQPKEQRPGPADEQLR